MTKKLNKHDPTLAPRADITRLAVDLVKTGTHSIELAQEVQALARHLHQLWMMDPVGGLDRFLNEPDRWADRAARLAALRTIELAAGGSCEAIRRPDHTIPTFDRTRRPLLDIELATLAQAARLLSSSPKERATETLLVEIASRATAMECAMLTAAEVDLLSEAVALPGAGRPRDRRHRTARRFNVASASANEALHLLMQNPGQHILHNSRGKTIDDVARASAITMATKRILAFAGLGDDPTVSFESVSLGAARKHGRNPEGFDGLTGSDAAQTWLGVTDPGYANEICALRDPEFDRTPMVQPTGGSDLSALATSGTFS
jgi:hypothetical protein